MVVFLGKNCSSQYFDFKQAEFKKNLKNMQISYIFVRFTQYMNLKIKSRSLYDDTT